jgi:hypothetical protein
MLTKSPGNRAITKMKTIRNVVRCEVVECGCGIGLS